MNESYLGYQIIYTVREINTKVQSDILKKIYMWKSNTLIT